MMELAFALYLADLTAIFFKLLFFFLKLFISYSSVANALIILIPDNVSCNLEFSPSNASCRCLPERFSLFAYLLTVITRIGVTTMTPKVKSKSI